MTDRQRSTGHDVQVRPIRAVTLDVNGTLIHPPRLFDIYTEVLARHGIEVNPKELEPVVRLVWEELECSVRFGEDRFAAHPEGARGWWGRFADRVCEHLGVDRPSRFAKAELFDRFARAEAWEIYPEVTEVLDQLAAEGIRLAVVSNWDERLPELLEDLGLAAGFEAIVYSAAVGAEKPHPAIFQRALDLLGEPPSQALHVGDRRRQDLEGALALGMQALHLDRHAGQGDLQDLTGLLDLELSQLGRI
ncbi:MAG: HAD family hydrolase [Acidobacteria bacterium]|nr:MAG: HAD family hydrolase [Acidobacteriota bacterium]